MLLQRCGCGGVVPFCVVVDVFVVVVVTKIKFKCNHFSCQCKIQDDFINPMQKLHGLP